MAGCASSLDIRPLATGRVDLAAYELRGQDLAPLQREAQRLCPAGAEVLRHAVAGQTRQIDSSSPVSRWLGQAGRWMDPPQAQAQMVVLCRAMPQDSLIAPGGVPPPAGLAAAAPRPSPASASVPDQALAAAPIGPVMPEW